MLCSAQPAGTNQCTPPAGSNQCTATPLSTALLQHSTTAAQHTQKMTEPKPLIVAGADGFGEDLKNVLVEHCRAQGYEVDDLGTGAYYDKAGEVARRVQTDGAKGLLFCGTGMGVGIVANRFSGIQAATCENVAAARCARAINDSNVLCLGGKVTTPEDARAICDAWLAQEHGKPPSNPPPEWWSGDVENFLENKWPAIHKVEDESRKH